VVRGARLDRNPLRRAADRIQTCLLIGLFVALAAAVPFLVRTASRASYAGAMQTRAEQMATRHVVDAVLIVNASQSNGFALTTGVLTDARWTSAAGVHRSGPVPAPPGALSGQQVKVWTDDSTGYLIDPPLSLAEAAGQADAAMVGTIAGLCVLYVVGACLAVCLLDRRRMAAWEADWSATEPEWNRQQPRW
jgi:hypothetical protein